MYQDQVTGSPRPTDLAHEPDFRIGAMEVRPSLRVVTSETGEEVVLEPRVMQVLVELAKARGSIVSRDDLIARCWGGQVVGDGAINRAISLLRALAGDMPHAAFSIETVPKVGYRLVAETNTADESGAGGVGAGNGAIDRRKALIGGIAAVCAVGLAGAGYAAFGNRSVPREAQQFFERGMQAMREDDGPQYPYAASQFREAVRVAPEYADGWGMLALAYQFGSSYQPDEEQDAAEMRIRSAADRAFALDTDNPAASAALAWREPVFRNWADAEEKWRALIAHFDELAVARWGLAWVLYEVGRTRDAAEELAPYAAAVNRPHTLAQLYWDAGRTDEAQMVIEQALADRPRDTATWFRQFWIFLRSGQEARALALISDESARPLGIPDSEFERLRATATAYAERTPGAIEAAMAANLAAARQGRRFCESAIEVACELGQTSTAFDLAESYFFDPRFFMDASRAGKHSSVYVSAPRTGFLLAPACRPMFANPRYMEILGEIGLTDYWEQTGTTPDRWPVILAALG
ncbi:winged helix-turn-helix domain-containing protein [Erythrobacter rubeus]|uniref:Winged helix-turn-helix domain-containing protein n=1 Tax=Erythrobacter rubeus TaxID=2760803 RepID=A0ABR8KWJ7_9SPHN|nr:winged helix-turn-helix domain-containing protein [Erythrobacter rubeus]MBD2842576.1 winged helix-turn-helix domain-containing protein [Erythrobacter rubeus]